MAIIKMTSKTFLEKFIQKHNPLDFQIGLISNDIENKGKFDNVANLSRLFPDKKLLKKRINIGEVSFKEGYLEQIKENFDLLASIIITAVEHNENVILLCSVTENDIDYIGCLSEYIESKFGIEVFNYKKVNKKPKLLTSDVYKDLKDDVLETLSKEIKKFEKNHKEDLKINKVKESEWYKDYLEVLSECNKKTVKKMFKKFSDIDKDELDEISKKTLFKMAEEFGCRIKKKQLREVMLFLQL